MYQDLMVKIIEHIELTFISVFFAILIGVPLGITITFAKKSDKYVLAVMNVIQAIPSLAMLGFLIPITKIGTMPAIIMVVLYSLLPIVKNTYIGIKGINPKTLEAASGIGLTNFQILKKITLPLALPVIMAGVRISAVTAVGLMTIAAFVGAGGLGEIILRGVNQVDNKTILIGAIPACILALFMDFFVSNIEWIVTPKPLREANSKNKSIIRSKIIIGVTVIAVLLLIISSTITPIINDNKNTGKKVVIGSKNYTEQMILGNILADIIEDKTDYVVERKLNLGSPQVTFMGLQEGTIDIYVEYTGSAYTSILGYDDNTLSEEEVYEICKADYEEQFGMTWLNRLGFNNTYAIGIRQEDADKYGIKKISDLAKYGDRFTISPTLDFADRPDGLEGIEEAYGFEFKNIKPVDGSSRYVALDSGASDAIDAFTTDGLIEKFDVAVLEDDKKFFPGYYAYPITRVDFYNDNPEVMDALYSMENLISEEEMMNMNYQVDVQGFDAEIVANEFLLKKGFIKE